MIPLKTIKFITFNIFPRNQARQFWSVVWPGISFMSCIMKVYTDSYFKRPLFIDPNQLSSTWSSDVPQGSPISLRHRDAALPKAIRLSRLPNIWTVWLPKNFNSALSFPFSNILLRYLNKDSASGWIATSSLFHCGYLI